MKILVTGAAGFIGSHFSEKAKELGHEVVGIDSFTNYYPVSLKELNAQDLKEKGIEIHRLDLTEPSQKLTELLMESEVVVHFAGMPGISNKISYDAYYRNNELAMYNIVSVLRQNKNLKCLFNSGTSSVYGLFATDSEDVAPKPASYYGVTKLAAEQLALSFNREEGFPVCGFRLFSVYGERERPDKFYPRLIMSLLEDHEVPVYEGSEQHVRSYTYVGDIVDGFILGLNNIDKCVGQIFNLGTDQTNTTGKAIEVAESIVGKKVRIKRLPRRTGDQEKTQANINKIRSVLGYNPTTTLEEGMTKDIKWFQEKILGKINFWQEVFGDAK